MGDTITGDIEGGTATLVCGARLDAGADDVCRDLLSAGEHRLWVTYTRSPDDCLAGVPDATPDRSTVISVGASTRSASQGGTGVGPVDAVGDPTDLTGLGIAIDRALERDVTVCFDSVTALLQYTQTEQAYEFLNSLLGRLWRADADAHFHLDPGAHDPETVAIISSLFDARLDAATGTVTRPTLPGR